MTPNPLDVECPYCHVCAGVACKKRRRNWATAFWDSYSKPSPHAARVRLAKERAEKEKV